MAGHTWSRCCTSKPIFTHFTEPETIVQTCSSVNWLELVEISVAAKLAVVYKSIVGHTIFTWNIFFSSFFSILVSKIKTSWTVTW